MRRSVVDNATGEHYTYSTPDEALPGDFLCNADGQVTMGPSGLYMEPDDPTPNHLQYAAAAKRIGISVLEYTTHRISGEQWCWRCESWKLEAEYSPHARRCIECNRIWHREQFRAKTAPRFQRPPVAAVLVALRRGSFAWRVTACPYCGVAHLHGAGLRLEDTECFLGLHRPHCLGPIERQYVLTPSRFRIGRGMWVV